MTNNFFDTGSPYLTHPLLTEARTAAEVDLIIEQLGAAHPVDRVLDLGCGFGRHAIEFARRGSTVVAVDPSATMIGATQQRAADAGVDIDVRQGDATAATGEPPFDVVICLFTTLGQQAGDESDPDAGSVDLLAAARTALRPGGTLVVECPEQSRAIDLLIADELLGPPDAQTHVTRSFDPATNVLSERFEAPDDSVFDLAVRIFTKNELAAMLEAAGFTQQIVTETALVPPPPTFMTVFAS